VFISVFGTFVTTFIGERRFFKKKENIGINSHESIRLDTAVRHQQKKFPF